MTGKKGGQKRFWSDDEKRSIWVRTPVPGVSVAQVARRYAMNANLIHKWLRDPRFVPGGADDDEGGEENTIEPPRVYRRVKLSKAEPCGQEEIPPKYTADLREGGVRLFREKRLGYDNDNAAHKAIAPKPGCLTRHATRPVRSSGPRRR